MGTVAKYARLVKFSHTVFAMPFALIGYVYALRSTGAPFEWRLLVAMVAAMVFARNAAMGFNRWADRRFDAENPRTAAREIPTGAVKPQAALWFVAANALLFVASAAIISLLAGGERHYLTLILSPVALFVILGYSYTKRFTSWSHMVLGMALAIAPVGAYIAVADAVAYAPIILAALVMTWVAGFDIIYSLQDADHDRTHGLHSIPARFPGWKGLTISAALHLVTVYAVAMFGLYTSRGTLYWVGAGIFVALLVLQHCLVSPTRLRNVGVAFGTVNGLASLVFAAFAIADLLV
ncbi:MAG: putative 4-hydroxybenzoate polyprenyltransferase [Alistipes sp.]|jgi:4-hydroxybenzoate polyprenyltransferase|nr:putative 4-hydroxybenzoate polyprenyltransferase [Alistipes sp.]